MLKRTNNSEIRFWGPSMNAHAQRAASDLFLDYVNDGSFALSSSSAIRLCNDIFQLGAETADLNTRLFCIRFVNFIFEHSELSSHAEKLSAYQWGDLEKLFMRDPSDPDATLAYALCKLNAGERERALQLLDRLARSGLRHAELSRTILRSFGPQSILNCDS